MLLVAATTTSSGPGVSQPQAQRTVTASSFICRSP